MNKCIICEGDIPEGRDRRNKARTCCPLCSKVYYRLSRLFTTRQRTWKNRFIKRLKEMLEIAWVTDDIHELNDKIDKVAKEVRYGK